MSIETIKNGVEAFILVGGWIVVLLAIVCGILWLSLFLCNLAYQRFLDHKMFWTFITDHEHYKILRKRLKAGLVYDEAVDDITRTLDWAFRGHKWPSPETMEEAEKWMNAVKDEIRSKRQSKYQGER